MNPEHEDDTKDLLKKKQQLKKRAWRNTAVKKGAYKLLHIAHNKYKDDDSLSMEDAITELGWFARNLASFQDDNIPLIWWLTIVLAMCVAVAVSIFVIEIESFAILVGPVVCLGFAVFNKILNGLKTVRTAADMTPRSVKRLVNVFKILKIIWHHQTEPDEDLKKACVWLLAICASKSNAVRRRMRQIFENIENSMLHRE